MRRGDDENDNGVKRCGWSDGDSDRDKNVCLVLQAENVLSLPLAFLSLSHPDSFETKGEYTMG